MKTATPLRSLGTLLAGVVVFSLSYTGVSLLGPEAASRASRPRERAPLRPYVSRPPARGEASHSAWVRRLALQAGRTGLCWKTLQVGYLAGYHHGVRAKISVTAQAPFWTFAALLPEVRSAAEIVATPEGRRLDFTAPLYGRALPDLPGRANPSWPSMDKSLSKWRSVLLTRRDLYRGRTESPAETLWIGPTFINQRIQVTYDLAAADLDSLLQFQQELETECPQLDTQSLQLRQASGKASLHVESELTGSTKP
jgi:hypothetical protein